MIVMFWLQNIIESRGVLAFMHHGGHSEDGDTYQFPRAIDFPGRVEMVQDSASHRTMVSTLEFFSTIFGLVQLALAS
jgi:hypothetical protein